MIVFLMFKKMPEKVQKGLGLDQKEGGSFFQKNPKKVLRQCIEGFIGEGPRMDPQVQQNGTFGALGCVLFL